MKCLFEGLFLQVRIILTLLPNLWYQRISKKESKKEPTATRTSSSKKRSNDDGSSKKRKQKKKKDPNAPKRAMSGFMFFSQLEREVGYSFMLFIQLLLYLTNVRKFQCSHSFQRYIVKKFNIWVGEILKLFYL